jgi:hypothetical protein
MPSVSRLPAEDHHRRPTEGAAADRCFAGKQAGGEGEERLMQLASTLLACAAVALAAGLTPAAAQTRGSSPPPRIDAKTHPELATLQAWLEGGTDAARQCALSGGLFQDANGLYRQTRSEPETVAAMMRAHGDALVAADRARLQAMVETVTAMAAGLGDLDRDSAAIAYARMCMSRAQDPGKAPTTAALGRQYEGAIACSRKGHAGSLVRKECVAAAFGGRL